MQVKSTDQQGEGPSHVHCPASISWRLSVVVVSIAWTSAVRTLPSCTLSLQPSAPTPTHQRSLHSVSWRRGIVVSVVRRMNEVTLRRARLVLGWVTVFGRVYHHGT